MATELRVLDESIPMDEIAFNLEHQEMIQLALETERTEAALKQMKERLKAFVDNNGSLYAGDKIWCYSSSVGWEFEPIKLKNLAMSIAVEGKDPWQYLSLPAGSLTKLGWDDSALALHGTKKVTKRFGSKKAQA